MTETGASVIIIVVLEVEVCDVEGVCVETSIGRGVVVVVEKSNCFGGVTFQMGFGAEVVLVMEKTGRRGDGVEDETPTPVIIVGVEGGEVTEVDGVTCEFKRETKKLTL